MEFIIKPLSNGIEYSPKRGVFKGKHKGKYIVTNISINITADDPNDLQILMMHKKKIEIELINQLNKYFSKRKDDEK